MAKEYGINRIYLDLFYSENMLDSDEIVKKYIEVLDYAIAENVKISGIWQNILRRHLANRKVSYLHKNLPSIDVYVDEYFSFNVHPPTKETNLYIKEFKNILESKKYSAFLNSVNNYFTKKCKGCYLSDSCFGSVLTNHRYHVMKDKGSEEACNFTRKLINAIKEKGYY